MAVRPDSNIRHEKISISYNNIGPAPSFIDEIQYMSQKALLYEKQHFPGACFACGAMPSVTGVPVQRCAGCQLVAYCNKNCQRANWKIHKIVCKTFPVELGKNAIVRIIESKRSESVRNGVSNLGYAMMELLRKADSLKEYSFDAKCLIGNLHACYVCGEARTEKCFGCRCCFISYCSESHRIMDTKHWSKECDILYGRAMVNWYLLQQRQLQIPDGLLDEVNLYDGIKFENVSKLSKFSSEKWLESKVHLINDSISYPMTILYALKNLKLGEVRKDLSEITSLTIHIVHFAPVLDPKMWEFMMHQLPDLTTLNITFINRHTYFHNQNNTNLPLERCSDCKRKQRIINYNIQSIYYHEYFSSDDYVEPDVVAVFDTFFEMRAGQRRTGENIEKADRFISQRNMTYGKHTVVILTTHEEDKLEDSVKSFQDARPIKVLLPIEENPAAKTCITAFSSLKIINSCRYLCCLQGNY